MSSYEKQFKKFWMDYSHAGQRVTKYSLNPKLYISEQLEILETVALRLIDLRKSRSTFSNDLLVDNEIDKLKNAIDSRSLKILSKSHPGEKGMDETTLRKKVLKASHGVPVSRGVFRAHEVISEGVRFPERSGSNEILKVATQGEGLKIEFKKSISLYEPISRVLVSFANTKGGSVYIGIAEEQDIKSGDGSIKIKDAYWATGVFSNLDLHRIKLMSYITEHTTLTGADLDMTVLNYIDKRILKISISPLYAKNKKLYFFNEDAYVRNDSISNKLSGLKIYNLVQKI